MIQSPVPGMTPARASEHTLQGLVSNINAYSEAWVAVTTTGTNTVFTVSQVAAKNIRLEAGASGAFTLTLPPTSKILDALGPTLPQDGSFWFPFYVYNNGVGQTATLTAGDGDTVIDAVNATIADSHISKWMVNVVAPVNGIPTTPMTLNFHFVFTACCSAVQPQTCPPDVLPVMLQFGATAPDTGGNNPNMVLQYDLSSPGTIFARVKDAAPLGTGTVTYAPSVFRSAIYNVKDDRMYFLATKTDSVGPVVTAVLVQYDPRNLVITGEMVLPAGWDTSNSVLIDVADERAWINSGFDNTFRAFDTVTLAEIFNDAGALGVLAGVTSAAIACASDTVLLPDASFLTLMHLITVTGPGAFTDTTIPVPNPGGLGLEWSNNGDFRRRWTADRNKVVLPYTGLMVDSGPIFALLDLNDLSIAVFSSPSGHSYDLTGPGTFWDPYLHKVVGSMQDNVGGHFGIFLGDDTGGTIGFSALDSVVWRAQNQTLGKFALASGGAGPGYGGFSETTPSSTPDEVYETSDNLISPAGNTWVLGDECIAVRRLGCTELPTFPRGSNLAWSYPGTGTAIAFFQLPGLLASDDNFQWVAGTGVTNALNNDAATYSTSGTPGVATGTFTTADAKTVTVTQGLITSIV